MIPASIRNNNPGAMYPGASSKKFGGDKFEVLRSKDGTHKIATFATPIHGAAANFDLMANGRTWVKVIPTYLYRGKTVRKAIETWCGGYYATTYIKVLHDRAGVGPDDILTLDKIQDAHIAVPLLKAMAWQEAGKDFPMPDEDWIAAHAMAFDGGSVAPSWNPRNDVPSPKWETRVHAVQQKVTRILGLAGGGGTAVVAAPWIPEIPGHVSQTVANLQAWKGLAGQLGQMSGEAWAVAGAGGGVAVAANLAVSGALKWWRG